MGGLPRGAPQSDVGDDHPGPIAKPSLQADEEIPAELIVLPKHGDLPFRIEGLDVIGIDAPLGTK